MLPRFLGILSLVALLHVSGSIKVTYNVLSTVYLPYTYDPTETYGLSENAAEQLSYDPDTKLIYSVGNTNIHVIDASDVTNANVIFNTSVADADATDVIVCGEHVFVAFDNQLVREEGFVRIYRVYNTGTKSLDLIKNITVGPVPDMLLATADCKTVLVAIEAEPYLDNVTVIDYPGGVGIIKFATDPNGNFAYSMANFTAFDDKYDDLKASGVRFVYQGNNNTFSNDIEPEYITFNKDESLAYISLQENNAIAVLDLASGTITDILGLGFKDWSSSALDPSDKDDGIKIAAWPVFGIYQPDAIKYFTHNDVDYIIAANEGDSKDYDFFSEEERVKKLDLSSAFGDAAAIADLQKDGNLGRLKVSTLHGNNTNTGLFDELYTFGGRSFSIRRADTMEVVYDSGDELARKHALLLPTVFNSDVDPDETVGASFDKRSDDKGIETESLTYGTVGNSTLLFVGNERPGTIAVYSVDSSSATPSPVFQTFIEGLNSPSGSWQDLYDSRDISMVDPEELSFVPSDQSPNGKALLLVSGSSSGTVSIVQVNVEAATTPDDGTNSGSALRQKVVVIASVIMMLSFFNMMT